MTALTHAFRRPRPAASDPAAPRDWRKPVALFMVVVLAHWVEHLLQAFQIYVLGGTPKESRGLLGEFWPWLVTSEWLHYGYAFAMLFGLIWLRPAFTGTARTWWMIALGLQVWHFGEHGLLLLQAILSDPFFGQAQPTSLAQLLFPRVELHLFYNAVVFTPMVVAIQLQFFARGHGSEPRSRAAEAG